MVFANTDCELGELNNDRGDRDRILPEYDPVSFHLSDIIKGNKIPDAIDISSESQKSLSYGSVDQPKDGSTVVFCEVTVTINDKTILKRVSGMAKAGEILAIMGPSGAGKSTLLTVMAGRKPVTSGLMTLNGQPLKQGMCREISYVLQTDSFYPILTLREVLTFASLLRIPDSTPHKLKIRRMLEIVDILELNSCLDTQMGSGVNLLKGGLSGGERKRASIACELIANPKLLLIDEPTSGLDFATAQDLMSSLTKLSKQQKKTIVTTIHQPSSQIFNMFSKVLLLVAGEVVYFGAGEKISDFFASVGLSFDPLINPADFIMESIKSDHERLKKMKSLSCAMRTQGGWPKELRESMVNLLSGRAPKNDLKAAKDKSSDVTGHAKWPTGFWTQYMTLTRRSFILSKDRFLSLLNLVHVVNMCIIGMEWFQIPRTESTITDRLGLIFFVTALPQISRCYISQFLIYDAWGVFETERSAGFYRLSAYYLGALTAEAPFVIVLGVCYATTSYWVTGLTPDVYCFFLFLLLLLLGSFVAQSLGIFISVLVHRRDFAASITTTVILTLIITAGFYNDHAHAWFDWIRYVSFLSRIWSSNVEIEYTYGDEFQCNPANVTSFPEYCTNGTTFPGSAFLSKRRVTDVPIYINITITLCNLIVLNVASYLCIRFLKPRPRS